MKTIKLPRSGQPALSFVGELVADDAGRWMSNKEHQRYHDVAIYRTQGEQYALQIGYRSSWKGETGHDFAKVFATPEDLVAFLRSYDPTQHVQGFPALPAYEDRQKRLLQDVSARFAKQVSSVLTADEFSEQVV